MGNRTSKKAVIYKEDTDQETTSSNNTKSTRSSVSLNISDLDSDLESISSNAGTSICNDREYKERVKKFILKKISSKHLDDYMSSPNSVHEDVTCGVCNTSNFSIDRYKCLICKNYNLCGQCYEERKVSGKHVKQHVMVRFSGPNELFGEEVHPLCIDYESIVKMLEEVSHDFSSCNGCGREKIIGPRFKCDECDNYNLCKKCHEEEVIKGNHRKDHCVLVCDSLTNFTSKDIKFIEEIGSGSFGVVYKAKLISKNKIVACKIIEYTQNELKSNGLNEKQLTTSFERESRAYNELNSNYIIKLYGCFLEDDGIDRRFYMLTEYMNKGCLYDVIENENSLSYRRRLSMACNIASGMRRLHDKTFMHRDLRPHNIFVDRDYVAKIGDMGLARMQDSEALRYSVVGCSEYMPKEFYSGRYTEKLDIYSFGLTLYHLFTGRQHVYDRRRRTIELNLRPAAFSELINECVNDTPNERPTAKFLDSHLSFYYEILCNIISSKKNYAYLDEEMRREFFIDVYNLTTDTLKNKNI